MHKKQVTPHTFSLQSSLNHRHPHFTNQPLHYYFEHASSFSSRHSNSCLIFSDVNDRAAGHSRVPAPGHSRVAAEFAQVAVKRAQRLRL